MISIADSDMYTPNVSYDIQWKCVPALEGPSGLCQAYYRPISPSADNQTCITTDCENPLAAFIVLDYLCDEATSVTCRYGGQGVNWDYLRDADVDPSDYEPAYSFMGGLSDSTIIRYEDALIGDGGQNDSYQMTGPAIIPATVWSFAIEKDPQDESQKLEKARFENLSEGVRLAQEVAREEVVFYLPMTAEEQKENIDPKIDVTKYVNESTAAFLTGAKDIDADWDEYLRMLESLGVNTLLKNYQAAWDRVEK
jgi:putative aldouronate transport system substrate-binding protein